MADIFLSYAEEDRPKARILARSLEERGWTVFWDRKIRFGESWREVIERELAAARAVVVAWSEASVGSSWVQEEADDARERGILVPVQIEPVAVPIGFRSVQTADLSGWDGSAGGDWAGFDALCGDIEHLLGRPPSEPRADPRAATRSPARRSGTSVRSWIARLAGALVGAVIGFFIGGSTGQLLVGGSAENFHYLITAGIVAGVVAGFVAVFYVQRRQARRALE